MTLICLAYFAATFRPEYINASESILVFYKTQTIQLVQAHRVGDSSVERRKFYFQLIANRGAILNLTQCGLKATVADGQNSI